MSGDGKNMIAVMFSITAQAAGDRLPRGDGEALR